MSEVRAAAPQGPTKRQPWVSPQVTDLPRLTELTLVTGGGIPCSGGTGGGGTGLCP